MSIRDESTLVLCRRQNLPEVIGAELAVELEAELREFHRDLAGQASRTNLADDGQVVTCRGLSDRRGCDVFSQMVQRVCESALSKVLSHPDRVVEGLSTDEASREATRPSHAVSGDRRVDCRAVGEGEKKRSRNSIQHQSHISASDRIAHEP